MKVLSHRLRGKMLVSSPGEHEIGCTICIHLQVQPELLAACFISLITAKNKSTYIKRTRATFTINL